MREANEEQGDPLQNILEFNNKVRPKSKENKK